MIKEQARPGERPMPMCAGDRLLRVLRGMPFRCSPAADRPLLGELDEQWYQPRCGGRHQSMELSVAICCGMTVVAMVTGTR